MSANPILAMLDAAAVPWREPRAALAARYGVRPDPWYGDRPIVPLDLPRPLLGGLMRPIWIGADPRYAPDLPAPLLSGLVRAGDDALGNLRLAAAGLAVLLGPGRPWDTGNTRGWIWQDGAAAAELICWPPQLQHPGLRNAAHEREPRLAAACHLTIATGYCPPLASDERAALEAFEEIGRTEPPGTRYGRHPNPYGLDRQMAAEYTLEFIRDPGPDRVDGRIGVARGHLIFGRGLLHVISVDRILRFGRLHLRPARGPGMTELSVLCATGRPEWPEKRVEITAAFDLAETEALAARLSQATGRPVERTEGVDD